MREVGQEGKRRDGEGRDAQRKKESIGTDVSKKKKKGNVRTGVKGLMGKREHHPLL